MNFLWICAVLAVVGCTSGKDGPMARIVGGRDTLIEEVPWQVSIQYYGFHYCGGAVVNSRTIITAAHCLVKKNITELTIRLGSSYRWKEGVVYRVKSTLTHPDYDKRTIANDVGIIKTESYIDFGQDIQYVRLAVFNDPVPVGREATLSGWGLLHPNGEIAEILQSTTIPILSQEICEKYHPKKITNSMFCAGALEGGRDACQQDSGGPLVVDKVLVGIVSWGDGCARPLSPGVYTNVAYVKPWISYVLSLDDD